MKFRSTAFKILALLLVSSCSSEQASDKSTQNNNGQEVVASTQGDSSSTGSVVGSKVSNPVLQNNQPAADQSTQVAIEETKGSIKSELAPITPEAKAQKLLQEGNVLLEAGNSKKALKRFHEAIRNNPNLAEIYDQRAIAFTQLGKLKQAKEASEKAAELRKQQQ
jgi:Flp pilus assembly protein TadD